MGSSPIQQPGRARFYKPRAKLVVRALRASAQRGTVQFGAFALPCALGRSGVRSLKREGDGATPRGRFPLRFILFKPHHLPPRTPVRLRAIARSAGWCDDPSDRNYNREVRLPYGASAERLWREDGLYDIVIVLGHNDAPRIKNRGSAVFMHVARSNLAATEGCVALRARDLRRLISILPRNSEIVIET